MVVAGVATSCFPFIASLRPNARAYAALPRVPIGDMQPASFKFVVLPSGTKNWPYALMVVRRADGTFNAWLVGYKEQVPHLPDRWWWRPGNKCPGLRADFQEGVITCPAGAVPDWYPEGESSPAYKWTLDGRFLGGESWIPDMEAMPIEQQLGDLVVGAR